MSVPWPASHATNDIAICLVETANQSLSTPSGWNDVYTPTGSGNTRLHAFWKRATSGAESDCAIGDSGDHQIARIVTYRNCVTSGSPIDAVTQKQASGNYTFTFDLHDAAQAGNEVLLAAACSLPDSTTSNTRYGRDNSTGFTSITEIVDNSTSSGDGGGISAHKALASSANMLTDGYVFIITITGGGTNTEYWEGILVSFLR